MPIADRTSQAVETLLRRLGIAIKTFALYSQPHPVTAQRVADVNAVLGAYMDAHGAFAMRVLKHAVIIDGVAYEGGAHGNLAFHLYTRKLSSITITPGVTEKDLLAFLSVVGTDRLTLEASGCAEQLLWQAGVTGIQVTELTVEQQELAEGAGPNPIPDLLRADRMGPATRDGILEMLRGGPEQAAALLEELCAHAADAGAVDQDQMHRLALAIGNLDRLILDEPFEDQAPLYVALAQAPLLVAEALRERLFRALLTPEVQDTAERLLGEHLSAGQLADVLQGMLQPGDPRKQLAAYTEILSAHWHKGRTALSILEERVRPPRRAPHGWLADAVLPMRARPLVSRPAETSPEEEAEEEAQLLQGRESAAERGREAQAIDEAGATREVIQTAVDLLRPEQDEHELADVAAVLTEHLPWLVDHQAYTMLARTLQAVREIAAAEPGPRGEICRGIVRGVTEGAVLERLLAALWSNREGPPAREIAATLEAAGGDLIVPLVRVLGTEPRPGVRAMICDLLVRLGPDHVDALGAFVDDPRWYLTRNIASVLGRLGNPRAVGHLDRLAGHTEYRVRREAVDALGHLGTDEAQTRIAAFLDDSDERIRLLALHSLSPAGVRRALPALVAFLDRRDPFQRQFALKQATVETLERLGATDALPVLRRLAGRFAFTARGRELRRLAGNAIRMIEAQQRETAQAHDVPRSAFPGRTGGVLAKTRP